MPVSNHMTFARALCMHFRLPMDQVMQGITVNPTPRGVMVVRFEVALTDDDMAGIARYMTAGRRREDKQTPLPPLDVQLPDPLGPTPPSSL